MHVLFLHGVKTKFGITWAMFSAMLVLEGHFVLYFLPAA